MKNKVLLAGCIFFIFLQTALSLSKVDFYPFNSYQMFSKNWQDGRVIAGIEVSVDQGPLEPVFKYTDIPFFQSNSIYLNAFYTQSDKVLQKTLCHIILDESKAQRIDIYGVMKKYSKTKSGSIVSSYDFKEKTYTCLN